MRNTARNSRQGLPGESPRARRGLAARVPSALRPLRAAGQAGRASSAVASPVGGTSAPEQRRPVQRAICSWRYEQVEPADDIPRAAGDALMPQPDYKRIAEQAVDLLCSVGFSGLHPSRQRELWQQALDLDRQLRPALAKVTVWTPEEGDVHPPRTEARPEIRDNERGTAMPANQPPAASWDSIAQAAPGAGGGPLVVISFDEEHAPEIRAATDRAVAGMRPRWTERLGPVVACDHDGDSEDAARLREELADVREQAGHFEGERDRLRATLAEVQAILLGGLDLASKVQRARAVLKRALEES